MTEAVAEKVPNPIELDPVELAPRPDISHIETEDDTPVDNIFSAKQQRLLVEPLYSSLPIDLPFLADANVGIFYQLHTPPLVPDMFLSLEVQAKDDWWPKENRSYFIWEFGKPPDVVIEIVSNKKGGELSRKLRDYARMGVRYYATFDPQLAVQQEILRVYELTAGGYVQRDNYLLPAIEMSLIVWDGLSEGLNGPWLRWCDLNGVRVLTGAEQATYERQRAEEERQRAEEERQRAEEERQRAEEERQRADTAAQRADQERQRAERLLAQLRAAGIEPEA